MLFYRRFVKKKEALVTRNDKDGVFVVDEAAKVAKFVPVTVGYRNTTQAEIVEPAVTGRVVVLGQHLLEDGMAIRIPSDEQVNGSVALQSEILLCRREYRRRSG